jgi:hypothetical protein
MKMWPFLIAANKQIDYNFVVCPEWIASKKRWKIFENPKFDWRDADNDALRVCMIDGKTNEKTVFVFKVRTFRLGDQSVVDLAGRPILMAYGFMAPASPTTPDDATHYSRLGNRIDSLPEELGDVILIFKDAGREWTPRYLSEEEVPITNGARRDSALAKRTMIAGVGAMCVSLGLNVILYQKATNSAELIETTKAEVAKVKKERDETVERLTGEATKISKERDTVAGENRHLQEELSKLQSTGEKD